MGPILPPSAPKISRQFALTPTGGFSTWQQNALMMDNKFFGGWFQARGFINLIAGMCMVESSGGLNLSRKVSSKDTSYGVMQVTPYTAQDIYGRGYDQFPPTETVLMTPVGGMYYGMAYVKILYENYKKTTSQEIARSYNGGPYYRQNDGAVSMTLAHWNKIRQYIG